MDIKATVESVPISWRTRLFWAVVFIFVAVIAYSFGVYWQLYKSQARIDELQQAYKAEQDKLYVLSQDRAAALKLVAVSAASLDKLQRKDDLEIEEAGRSVYERKMAVPDSHVPADWREFLAGVHSRGDQRKRK